MSKMKYTEPKIEIILLEAADIITASDESFEGEWTPIKVQGNYYDNYPTY